MFYFSQKQRRKFECPVEDCEAKVVNLARHLRDKHHWSVGSAASASSVYDSRKPYERQIKTTPGKIQDPYTFGKSFTKKGRRL